MSEMKIGVQLPEVERQVSWREIRDIARTAEEGGLDSLWVGDHLLYRDERGTRGPWEAWSLLAALAEVTDRVELGPLVAATGFHAPAMIAKKAATIDQISGGRLILGLGAGWNRVEYEAFGFPYDHRVSRFEEALTIIATLIREGGIDFEGDYHTLRGMELQPPARSDMKLMVGSNGPRMLRIALPLVDMWNTWHASYGNDPDRLVALMSEVDEACRDVGREPGQIGRTAAVHVQLPGGTGRRPGDPTAREESPPITGSREEIATGLAAFEATGLDHIQVVLDPIDAPSVEELARTVEHLRSR
ncbi:MAG: LLM class flavin-dependent oxidoreductase [Actinobacteria bacterium]|nr:LLM class flavin-dependent oxidoreductase [Actinomycetota bacterium]